MAVKAKGTLFKIGAVAYKIYKITPPSFERGEVITTTLDDGYVRKEPGEVVEVKNLEAELEFSDTIEAAFHTEIEKATVSTFSIIYASAKGWTITGFVTVHGVQEISEGKLVLKISVAIDGEPTPIP